MTEHPLENWIREDAVKVYETTARMPKVAYMVSPWDGSIRITSDPTVPVGELRMEQTADPTGKSGWGPRDAAAWPGKAMQHGKAVAHLTNKAVAPFAGVDRAAPVQSLAPAKPVLTGASACHACGQIWGTGPAGMVAHRAACKSYDTYCAVLGAPPVPKPVDPYTCCGERMLHHPMLDQVHCPKCRRVVTGMEMSDLASQRKAPEPVDPLDVKYDGVDLRELLLDNELNQQERGRGVPRRREDWMTAAQRAAVSAHWSAELRAKVAASAAAAVQQDRARISCDPRDPIDLED